ncbi:hypothetical protein ACFYRJ_17285 [Streptomyces sp. NPDC005531]|uniref:hypothetical protein n=1 Tax=Streptomyces sp. NPDC005531 TaxID=3364722 RepID=UPI00367D4944
MADDSFNELASRRRVRRRTGAHRAALPKPINVKTDAAFPAWATKFVIPRNACEACAQHWHHKCWGVNVLLDPIPDCPCGCGHPKDSMRLSNEAWADLALHAPDQVWIAAMFERQRTAGIHACVMDDKERHRAVRWEDGR